MPGRRIRLVAFDLDGTLTRGESVCEVMARRLGRLGPMREFERLTKLSDVQAAREVMAQWYAETTPEELLSSLASIRLAPGTVAGCDLLRRSGIQIAIVSITWEFAVAWFARRLHADQFVGTQLLPDGEIKHFWPADKATWLEEKVSRSGLSLDDVAAVGDSLGDVPMLRIVGHPFFVGRTLPAELVEHATHWPDANILELAKAITTRESANHRGLINRKEAIDDGAPSE